MSTFRACSPHEQPHLGRLTRGEAPDLGTGVLEAVDAPRVAPLHAVEANRRRVERRPHSFLPVTVAVLAPVRLTERELRQRTGETDP